MMIIIIIDICSYLPRKISITFIFLWFHLNMLHKLTLTSRFSCFSIQVLGLKMCTIMPDCQIFFSAAYWQRLGVISFLGLDKEETERKTVIAGRASFSMNSDRLTEDLICRTGFLTSLIRNSAQELDSTAGNAAQTLQFNPGVWILEGSAFLR